MIYGQSHGAEAAQKRRRWSLAARVRIAVLLGLVVALVLPPSVVSMPNVANQILSATSGASPTWVNGPADQAVPDGGPGAEAPSGATRPGVTTLGPLRDHIMEALNRQSTALRSGDLGGFLAIAAPGAATLRDELRRRFTSLRAMGVATWEQSLAGGIAATGGGSWSAPVRLRYCFVVAGCAATTITVDTAWAMTVDHVVLTEFGSSGASQTGPRPWEVSELRAAVGERVLVAGTSRWASRLSGVLASAERAAAVTDHYARWDEPPGRYVVYVAGPDEWAAWYGVRQASWVAAYAMPLTDTYTEIVLNAAKVSASDAREVLQHEFTHVVTLSGARSTYPGTWWLVEGLAEYVQNQGRPISTYRALTDGWRYANSAWNGSVALDEPGREATVSEANGRYAVAYLAVRWLVERYGEAKALEFFAAVARNGAAVTEAAPITLRQPWLRVSADCSAFVRRSLGMGAWAGSRVSPR